MDKILGVGRNCGNWLPVVLLVLVLFGCRTEDGNNLTGKALLTSIHWKIKAAEGSYTVKLGGIPFLNDDFSLTDSLSPCQVDDYIAFFPDDTYQAVDDGLRCDDTPSDGIIDTGNYHFDGENNKFALDIFDDDLEGIPDDIAIDPYFDIEELNAATFRLTKVIEESFTDNGVTFTISANINLTMVPK